jgi:hypothetical protein
VSAAVLLLSTLMLDTWHAALGFWGIQVIGCDRQACDNLVPRLFESRDVDDISS